METTNNNNVMQCMYQNAIERVGKEDEDAKKYTEEQDDAQRGKDNDKEKKAEQEEKVPMEKVPMETEENVPKRTRMRWKGGMVAASTSQEHQISA